MDLIEKLNGKIHVYDGSKGTILMRMGLRDGEYADLWNIEHSDKVYNLHKDYVAAGSDIIQTNTMQGSRYHLEARGIYEKLRNKIHIYGIFY